MRDRLPIFGIMIAALVVRFVGLDFGMPLLNVRPDELPLIERALGFVSGDLNPRWFHYPTLFMYAVAPLYLAYFMILSLTGSVADYPAFANLLQQNPSPFFVLARSVSAVMGSATVYLVYRVAKEEFSRGAALISAFFLGFAYLHVRDSHFAVTDVSMTFMVMLSFVFIMKSRKYPRQKHYLLAGIFAGLATSTKYPAIAVAIPMFVAHVFNVLDHRERKFRVIFDPRIFGFAVATAAFFFLGSPFTLLGDFSKFVADFSTESKAFGEFPWKLTPIGWWYHLRVSLFHGMGWPLFFVSLAGMTSLLVKDMKNGLVIVAFPAAIYLIFGGGYKVFVRYLIPTIPLLCLAAGVLSDRIIAGISSKLERVPRTVITAVFSLLVILPSLRNIVHFEGLILQEDNRLVTARWADLNLVSDDSIYMTGAHWGHLQQRGGQLMYPGKEPGEGKRFRFLDFVPESGIFVDHNGNQLSEPDYIFVQDSPLTIRSSMADGVRGRLSKGYELQYEGSVGTNLSEDNLYDPLDAFYIPFAGFRGVERPGPSFSIYGRSHRDKPTR